MIFLSRFWVWCNRIVSISSKKKLPYRFLDKIWFQHWSGVLHSKCKPHTHTCDPFKFLIERNYILPSHTRVFLQTLSWVQNCNYHCVVTSFSYWAKEINLDSVEKFRSNWSLVHTSNEPPEIKYLKPHLWITCSSLRREEPPNLYSAFIFADIH